MLRRCDDSHRDDDPQPLSFSVSAQQSLHYLCQCKYTTSPPFCDGSHNHVVRGYEEGRAGGDGEVGAHGVVQQVRSYDTGGG